jgi:hypothetical protein
MEPHVSVPLFSVLDALIRVVLERNRKKEGCNWFGIREVASELCGSQTLEKVRHDIGCAS